MDIPLSGRCGTTTIPKCKARLACLDRRDGAGFAQACFLVLSGVMFIVDSADPIRIEEAKATLVEVISHDKLKGVPLLCLANKQDKPEALSIQDTTVESNFLTFDAYSRD